MEQHVEEITSCCQEYVIGGSDQEPVRILARGIRTSHYDLHKLVVVLGPHLTSLEEVRRARSTSLLSEVLGQLPEYQFTNGEVQHLITFYCDRLKDKVSVIPHVLFGLQIITSYQLISNEQVVQVSQAIFKELYVQSLPVLDRKMVFTILSSFLANHVEAVQTIGSDFVFGYIQAIDGEKDPRNLLIIFKSSVLVIHNLPIDNFVEDLFEVSACYFPIDFTPPANDPHHITKDDLVSSLRAVLCATPLFAEPCLPLLMEKLSSDVHGAKIDSLLTLAAGSEMYRAVIVKNMEQVWSAIRNEVYHSVSQTVEEACHVAIRSITRCLSAVVTKSNSDLLKWVELILQDCKRHFSSPDLKLLPPTGQLLCHVAEGSESACHIILTVVLPLLVEQCKLHHQMNEQKLIIIVLLSFLRVSQSLVTDTTGDTAKDINSDSVTPLMTHRDDILALLLTSLNNAHLSLRTVAVTGLVGLLALNGILSTEQVMLCSDHMIHLALHDPEEGLRKESALGVAFISEHYPIMFREKLLSSLLDKMNINKMDRDDHHSDFVDRVDQSRILRLLCVVSGRHNIASVTLPWLLNYLRTITSTAYSDKILEHVGSVMDCVQSIMEHLSVLCDDTNNDDINYLKPFLLGLLKLFIGPTLDGGHIPDPHILTNSGILSKCAASLRVGVQGVNSKIESIVAEATISTFWSLIAEVPGTYSFNPFDPSSPWQQTQLISLVVARLSSLEPSGVLRTTPYMMICRDLACHTHHQLTCVHASKLYANIVNKLPAGDEMDYCVTTDMGYVWNHYHCHGDDMVKIRAVTWWIWTTKALVIRSHPLGRAFTVKLLTMFASPDPVAKVASDGIYIILNEAPNILNTKSCAIIKLMHRQQFFTETVPLLVEQLNIPHNAYKQYYLRALSHVMQAVPKQVLLGELPSLLPLLIASLECRDDGLQLSTLDGIYALIFDAPDVMSSYIPTLVPKLLHLAQQAVTMKVRISSLQCLGALSGLPVHQMLPYKGEVIQSLEVCLDDKKRLVRKEAVKSRASWFLLGAVV